MTRGRRYGHHAGRGALRRTRAHPDAQGPPRSTGPRFQGPARPALRRRQALQLVTTSAVLGIAAVALGLVLTPGPNMIYLVSRSIA